MTGFFRLLLVSLVFTLGTTNLTHAASFDCTTATTETEIAICNDPELSALDEKLGQLWGASSRSMDEIRKQREWVAVRDNLQKTPLCKSKSLYSPKYINFCLGKSYEYRIIELITDCPIEVDIPKLLDNDYPLDELEKTIAVSDNFEACKIQKIFDVRENFETLSEILSLMPLDRCFVSIDPFMYPISENRGHYIYNRCTDNNIKQYEILLEAMIALIKKRNPEYTNIIYEDQLKWSAFGQQACTFYTTAPFSMQNIDIGERACRREALKFRILYLSPFIGIDYYYGERASTIEEVLGKGYGEYQD